MIEVRHPVHVRTTKAARAIGGERRQRHHWLRKSSRHERIALTSLSKSAELPKAQPNARRGQDDGEEEEQPQTSGHLRQSYTSHVRRVTRLRRRRLRARDPSAGPEPKFDTDPSEERRTEKRT